MIDELVIDGSLDEMIHTSAKYSISVSEYTGLEGVCLQDA